MRADARRGLRSTPLRVRQALLVVLVPLSALAFSLFSVEAFEFPKALLLRAGAILLLAVGVIAPAPRESSEEREPLGVAFAGLLAAASVSMLFGLSPRTSLLGAHESFQGLATLAAYAVVFVAARACVRGAASARALLGAAAVGGSAAAAYAVPQMLGLDPVPWSKHFEAGAFVRVGSTFGNPNFLGGFAAGALPLVLALGVISWRRGVRTAAVVFALSSALLLVSIGATFSRGAWGATLVSLGALAIGWRAVGETTGYRVLRGAALAALLGLGIALTATDVGGRFVESARNRLESTAGLARSPRADAWRAAAAMFSANPLTGVGIDNFQLGFSRYQPVGWTRKQTPLRAHNEIFHVAATQGVVGLAALAGLVLAAWIAFRRALRLAVDRDQRSLVIAVAAALLALSARTAVGFTVVATGVLFCVLLGVLAGLGRGNGRDVALAPVALGALLGASATLGALVLLGNALAAQRSALFPAIATACAIAVVGWSVAVSVAFLERRSGHRHGVAPGAAPEATRTPRESAGAESGHLSAAGTAARALGAAGIASVALYLSVYLPFRADAHARIGEQLLDMQTNSTLAAARLEAAVSTDPTRAKLWVMLGVAHHEVAETTQEEEEAWVRLRGALAAQIQATRLVPARGAHHANVGRTLGSMARRFPDRVDEGDMFAAFDRALERAPHESSILEDACKAAFLVRDADAMERYGRRWLAAQPGDPRPRSYTAAAFLLRDDLDAAEAEMRLALSEPWERTTDEAGVWSNLAHLLLQRERFDEANAAAREALRRVPNHREAARALHLAELGAPGPVDPVPPVDPADPVPPVRDETPRPQSVPRSDSIK